MRKVHSIKLKKAINLVIMDKRIKCKNKTVYTTPVHVIPKQRLRYNHPRKACVTEDTHEIITECFETQNSLGLKGP